MSDPGWRASQSQVPLALLTAEALRRLEHRLHRGNVVSVAHRQVDWRLDECWSVVDFALPILAQTRQTLPEIALRTLFIE